MVLEFVWIGSTRNAQWRALERNYLQRINRYLPTSLAAVRELKKTDSRQIDAQLKRETASLNRRFKKEDYVICLAGQGKQLSSTDFARFLDELQIMGKRRACFVVGGHLGLSPEFQKRADFRLSLGKMTYPHEMARVVLLEQIFRGICLCKGIPYHY